MLRCWDLQPHARPSFEYIVEHLKSRMRIAEETAARGGSTDIYTNVPNTQLIYKKANPDAEEAAPALRPLDLTLPLTKNTPEQVNADDYLTPSEHYFGRDMTSQYLTSPSMSPGSENVATPSGSNVPIEHADSSFLL